MSPTADSLGDNGFDLDHTSFAVHDVMTWARRLRAQFGATPIAGEVLPEFRYLLLYIGGASAGSRLELMEPDAGGFLARYLDKHGEGPHHLTFAVPDLGRAVADARSLGLTVASENYEHPPWRDAFILPEGCHRVVIQLAQSDRRYPTPVELLETQHRDPATMPSSPGATDQQWWKNLWETSVLARAQLGATLLASADLTFSRELFEGVLGATVTETTTEHLECTWPGGALEITASTDPGVTGMRLHGVTGADVEIGSAVLSVSVKGS